MKFLKKRWVLIGAGGIALMIVVAGCFIAYANFAVLRYAEAVYGTVEQVPEREIGLLLGTSPIVADGRRNLYFTHRMDAAARLYHAGKIKKIIVSGDNRHKDYNEPQEMRRALEELGVTPAHIAEDYAGFRTLDSVVRARDVFGAKRYTVISQQFHCERALFIAANHDIEAVAFAAPDATKRYRFKRVLRETFARPVAWLDVKVLNRKPYFER